MAKRKAKREEACERAGADERPDDSPAREQDGSPADEEPYARVTPAAKRIGEGPDNLRQRSDWFQRRTGRRRAS
jgi:hypothetical protein